MRGLLELEEQKSLLAIARETIVTFIQTGTVPAIEIEAKGLNVVNGCFVTIHQKGALRGCIGNFISDKPLYRLVQEMSVAAATRDPRFYPMKSEDLDDFDLEISVLSPLEQISDVEQIQVGDHGLYIVKGSYRGVLLPQVAVEYGWSRNEFLNHTCRKAGLPEDAWQKECDIFVFSAQILREA